MKALLTLDYFVWKRFIPVLTTQLFQYKIFSVLALAYISLFKLPRRFLLHYFKGHGKAMNMDTKKLILENPQVFDKLLIVVDASKQDSQNMGCIQVCQDIVDHPNYKYAIGSFSLNYKVNANEVKIRAASTYHFSENCDRVTRYLHNQMVHREQLGKAQAFAISGSEWTISYSDLKSLKPNNKLRFRGNLPVVYM